MSFFTRKVIHTAVVKAQSIARPVQATVALGRNEEIIWDIADALQHAPPTIDNEYLTRVERAAAYLGNPVPPRSQGNTFSVSVRPLAIAANAVHPWGSVLAPYYSAKQGTDTNSNGSLRNAAMAARNNVFDVVNRVNAFIARAKNAGFSPPDNPFTVIAEINGARSFTGNVSVPYGRPNISAQRADDLVTNIGAYVDLLRAEREGKIDLEKSVHHAAQLSSAHMSFDGFGGSGNAATDLMRFLPDADAVKEQKAAEALAVLDFRRRVPKVIFTANYAPDGTTKGALVGFQRIADASGYVIKRRNIFDGKEAVYTVTNDDLRARWEHIGDYVKAWVLTFYDTLDPNTVFTYLDGDIEPNAYYIYRVQAFQIHNENKGAMFSVPFVPARLSAAQIAQLRQEFELSEAAADVSTGTERTSADTISPYPVLAKRLMGNDKFDWILAGVNVRASISRNDPRSTTRKYSYVSAQLSFIFDQMEQGKFVIPSDVNSVVQNVSDSISKFGVMQTIQEICQETGILYHFEGKDAKEDTHFDRVGTEDVESSGLLSTVVAAVDPETATMDLRSLATNMSFLLNGSGYTPGASTSSVQRRARPAQRNNIQTEEIEVPSDINETTEIRSEDEIQFVDKIEGLDKEQVDLTTFDGVSKFVRTIRVLSDLGPGRGAPTLSRNVALTPDPIPDPPPTRPATGAVAYVAPPRPVTVSAPPATVRRTVATAVASRPRPIAFTRLL